MKGSRVLKADYSIQTGVTLTLDCGHEIFVEGFPRSPIPPCFSIRCRKCAN